MKLDLSALDVPLGAVGRACLAPRAPLSRFEEDPNNPRIEFDDDLDFEDFVADIRTRGILQPLIVRTVEGTDKLRIRFGARRYRAAVRIGLAEIPYFVTEDERQFDDYSQVAENQQRRGLQPLELAKFITKRIAQGEKKKEVAAKLRLDPSAITHLLSLVDAPPFILELYHGRKCRAPHYLYELRRLHSKASEIVERRVASAELIDRRLLMTLAEEIDSHPQQPSEPGAASIKAVPDTATMGADRALAAAVNGSGGGGAWGGSYDHGVSVLHLPAQNPENEKKAAGRAPDPIMIKRPLLLGKYLGREVMIVLTRRPSAVGFAVVRFKDGSGEKEVVIGDITLSVLTDSQPA
jgi:ParB family chromosome partitioning protein